MPWLTPNVFKQRSDETLTQLPLFGDGPSAVRFRHIVHAYTDRLNPDNTAVQSITFETIRGAQRYAHPDYPSDLVVVAYPEDEALVPSDAIMARSLTRVVTDLADFAVARPLPLLFDVLKNGIEAAIPEDRPSAGTEYIVFSNSDIHLQTPFYRVVAELIRVGYDVITVNRRTVDAEPGNRSFSPLFMAELGAPHPGFDCFVFPAQMFRDFAVSSSCCGAGGVMRSLLFNLVAHARRFLMLTTAHMTFHPGSDRFWSDSVFADYNQFNFREALSVVTALAADGEKAQRLVQFINAHEGRQFRDALPEVLNRATMAAPPRSST